MGAAAAASIAITFTFSTLKVFFSSYILIYHTGNTSLTHSNLKKGAIYRYKVTAFDNAGNESAGVEIRARTKGSRTPRGLPLLLLRD